MSQNWYLPLTVMTFILGAFIALALKTENKVRGTLPSSRYSGLAEAYLMNNSQNAATILRLQDTISSQRADIDRLERASSSRPAAKEMEGDLRQARMFAGLTAIEGPGVIVTLKDSTKRPPSDIPDALRADLTNNYIIHDADIQRVVNELRAAGAEAFSVNGQRIVATTAIRCVGPAIQVNSVPLTPPFKISAIGDPATLSTALNLPGGVGEIIKETDPDMISVSEKAKIVLPAYAGAMELHYSHPVEDTDKPATSGASEPMTQLGHAKPGPANP
jgi:uncharacterized protein YlxW (UPF0749 family)